MDDQPDVICLPMKVDAFVLNPDVCNNSKTKIPPLSQPNYTFLRLDANEVQSDVLGHVDLHATTPCHVNRRVMDLGTNSAARSADQGFSNPTDPSLSDVSAPNFRAAPTRWLVVRTIQPDSMIPAGAIPAVQGWVIEGDRRWDLQSIPAGYDLETDFTPFVVSAADNNDNIEQQAEVFVGNKTDATIWTETGTNDSRIALSLLTSANPVFADFQPHNSNVFSMLDNFQYGPIEAPLYLQAATADYYVIGWHYNPAEDVFYIPQNVATTLGARLKACNMALGRDPSSDNWSGKTSGTRLFCHGAMYSVDWKARWTDPSTNAYVGPKRIPADDAFAAVNKTMSMAVGTTPLDAMLAYVAAHVCDTKDPLYSIEQDIVAIQALLIAQDDGVEAQLEAQDLVYNYNYARDEGGVHWHISGDDGSSTPVNPDNHTLQALEQLNATQLLLDSANRRVRALQWSLFAEWWKYVSDASQKKDAPSVQKCVTCIKDKINALGNQVTGLKSSIKTIQDSFPKLVKGTQPRFFQQKDPTLFVAGVQPGWPTDFLDSLTTRLASQIVTGSGAPDSDFQAFVTTVVPRLSLPEAMSNTVQGLLNEFILLNPTSGSTQKPGAGQFLPLYHDQVGAATGLTVQGLGWRDRWESTQPWFPLFLEWEAEYTHLPYSDWELSDRPVPGSSAYLTQVRYNIKKGINLADEIAKESAVDKRTISGRIIMLPQPGFSLATKVKQLFSNTVPEVLDKYLSKDKRDELLTGLGNLASISAPLAGFSDHLVTQVQGGHIKPSKRLLGEKAVPMQAAVKSEVSIGLDEIGLMGIQTDLTPYGSLVEYLPPDYSAFKPVTHGQFRFTKMNIIDKFGQAIHAIDPTPSDTDTPPVWPCISDFYSCQWLPAPMEDYANTVIRDKEGWCEYVQVSPQINQMSRLNANFVVRNSLATGQPWRPVMEWENPIWGWMVVNYADYGLQFFTAEGKFYREVRLGGPKGSTVPKQPFLPFGPATETKTQLDFLIAHFADPDYLQSFIDMINAASEQLAPAPDSYAEYLSSLVGKPLALTNIGFSLELATDPLTNQSTRNNVAPELPILPPGSLPPDCPDCEPLPPTPVPTSARPGHETGSVPPSTAPPNYRFKVHVGDKDRVYDGLLGYFNLAPAAKNLREGDSPQCDYDLTKIFTYYRSKNPSIANPTQAITTDNFPELDPYYLRPDSYTTGLDYSLARNAKLTILGCILDPFAALHLYSDILPIGELKLPAWAVQSALSAMTAFFHMGPLVVTADVPVYDSHYDLSSKSVDGASTEPVFPDATIGLPSLAQADWTWLQPYGVAASTSGGGRLAPGSSNTPIPGAVTVETRFMGLKLGKTDAMPRYDKGPYTAVEGYLQLSSPVTKPTTAA
ncbi:uncharacterized protein AB675_11080 [Cyphellophora attinorum]|uniref:Uncharacterized protein n=1 Tax=Cyphellophora attinorum TaxID=1664694 RepID=A0A0N1NXZ3_9EURO|nr:uncharacterized protein AB675_11080 [Phialophora attinorum]KPI35825.1 hypothetical protein AB675_11080 [Phialophora attinorum]